MTKSIPNKTKRLHNSNDQWRNIKLIGRVGLELIPFFISSVAYFVVIDEQTSEWLPILLKCLPIICLCIFVILHGIGFNDRQLYSGKIFLGLTFSLFGDIFLAWSTKPSFIYGVVSFGIAHLFYISAYGWNPLNSSAGAIIFSIGFFVYSILFPHIKGKVLSILIPLYSTILCTMLWRAFARAELLTGNWKWTKMCSFLGALVFLISDTLLALYEFNVITNLISPIRVHQIIMITYYAAQLGIALSVVDTKTTKLSNKNSKKSPPKKHN